MHKLNIEIHPFSSKGLSPRYHLTQTQFRNIRQNKMIEFNGCCENCGKSEGKIELHEGGIYKNKCYTFSGFYLLCEKCHDMVHCINVSSNRFGVPKREVSYICKHKYDIKKYSKFKSKAKFEKHVYKIFEDVFKFMMADMVTCDYSMIKNYGLDPAHLTESFNRKYDHFSCRIRYIAYYAWWYSLRKQNGIEMDKYFWLNYKDKKKTKKYLSKIHNEYLKHQEFYNNKQVFLDAAGPEREKLILEYSEVMKNAFLKSQQEKKSINNLKLKNK